MFPEEEVAYSGGVGERKRDFSEKILMNTRTTGRRDNMKEEEVVIWDALNNQVIWSHAFFS